MVAFLIDFDNLQKHSFKLIAIHEHLPFLRIIYAHAELPRACVHTAADHEAVTWLKNMQGTRHGGVRHGTHKDRHIFCQTAEERHILVIN